MSDGRAHFYESQELLESALNSVRTEAASLEQLFNTNSRIRFVPRHPRHCPYPESERLLDDGFLHVIGHFGSESLIAQAARTSTDRSTQDTRPDQDTALLDRLIRDSHTSPFEMASITWHVRAPLFVLTQWLRHRASKFAHVNMLSGRYSRMQESFLQIEPSEWRKQDPHNKQMTQPMSDSDLSLSRSMDLSNQMSALYAVAWECYQSLLGQGVGREQARIVLPYAAYSEMWWQCDLHNLGHFLKLRTASDAQPEIRVYAERMLADVRERFPNIAESWENHIFGAVTFSTDEQDWLKDILTYSHRNDPGGIVHRSINTAPRGSARKELQKKLERLGLGELLPDV